jgi:HEAT repeat protein
MQQTDRFTAALLYVIALLIANSAAASRADDDQQLTLAIEHLAKLDPSLPEERRELIATLNDSEQSDPLRRTALNRLASAATRDGSLHDALIACMKSGYGDYYFRIEAIRSLHAAGVPASRAVPVLSDALDDKEFRGMYKCGIPLTAIVASELASYGAEAKSAIPKLLEHDQKSALGTIDPWQFPLYARGEASVMPLAGVLVDDPNVRDRRAAASYLLQQRNIARPATDALIKALADADEEVRITSAAILVHLGDRADALNIFLSAINSKDAERRLFLSSWVVRFNLPLEVTHGVSRKLLDDDDARVRWRAAKSLDMADVYLTLLKDPDICTRVGAARELVAIESHGKEVFATLLEVICTAEGSDRFYALAAMRDLPQEIRAVGAPVFATLLCDDSRGFGFKIANYAARYLSDVQDPSIELRGLVEEAARQSLGTHSCAAKVLETWDGK